MTDTPDSRRVTIAVSAETVDRFVFLAGEEAVSMAEVAGGLRANGAEAQAGLVRGPHLRKFMYR